MFKRLLLAAFVVTAMPIIGIAQDTPAPAPATAPADTTTPPPAAQEEAPAPSSSSSSSSKSSIGFKFMYGVGQLVYDNEAISTSTSDAFSFGAFWNWSTGGVISFAIQPELHYISESGLTNGFIREDETVFDIGMTTESIRLPILLKLEFLTRDIVQPSIYVGPSLSYILAGRTTIGDTDIDWVDYEAFQAGLAMGVDVTFLRIFLIDIRYNTNFTSLVEEDPEGKTSSVSMNSLCIGLGLRF